MIASLLRIEEHKALSNLVLNGQILDLGGEANAYYQKIIIGDHFFSTVNISESAHPDFVLDLEKPLPFSNELYDHVLMMNVLEHIFEYRLLISESFRVLKTHGTINIVIPFLFPFHASPGDFHRFTEVALVKELEFAGFSDIKTKALGSGVFSVRLLLLDRLLPLPFRIFNHYVSRYMAYLLDFLFIVASKILGKRYKKEDYAMGYLVTGIK